MRGASVRFPIEVVDEHLFEVGVARSTVTNELPLGVDDNAFALWAGEDEVGFDQSGGINDRQTFESANLYQLHAYVSQLARRAGEPEGNSNSRPHIHDDRAEGMLLYATVGENNYIHRFAMPPHQMTVATVDLNMPWQGIEQRLMDLVLLVEEPHTTNWL